MDDDNDGVTDDKDTCPNTPTGETVNEDGCSDSQLTYVPDDNFEQSLIDLGYDDVLDDYVLTSNISGVTSLTVSYKGISDLTGIEDFLSLTYLECVSNYLVNIDVSKNTELIDIHIGVNGLEYLDVSQNKSLLTLTCVNNKLVELDVSNNLKLEYLGCEYNKIMELNISGLTKMTELRCHDNDITNLDVESLSSLESILCQVNKIKKLNFSNNKKLKYIDCGANQLLTLNLKNGNNSLIGSMQSAGNENLQCIQVDNEQNANEGIGSYSNWYKDNTSTYSEDCSSYLSVDDEELNQSIKFYPNPVSNVLSIRSETIPINKIEIYTVLGQKIIEVNSEFSSISTDNLSKGIYIIRIYSEKGTTVRKLIKE